MALLERYSWQHCEVLIGDGWRVLLVLVLLVLVLALVVLVVGTLDFRTREK